MRQQVRIPLPDGGALAATMALPEGTAPVVGWPGVVVVHEIYGVEPDMLDVVDLFAEHGYAAVLPDLYSHGARAGCLARVTASSARQRTTRGSAPSPSSTNTSRTTGSAGEHDGPDAGVTHPHLIACSATV
ncbi:dienelactone hydrolase family protein [Nonomuraea dietziae]|uniref:dienelactone hydrolase family protein n=1 Tax=Nonomuraea dietziae TaxID=65515 RepID=UPI0033F7DDBB